MISDQCLNLIKKWESLKLNAYLDGGGVPTIGWGTIVYYDGKKVKIGDVITADQAEFELIKHCEKVYESLLQVIDNDKSLGEHHYSALISFVYNIGIKAFKESTMLKLINKGDLSKAANEFDRWIYDNGKKVQGLVNRRKDEKALFVSFG